MLYDSKVQKSKHGLLPTPPLPADLGQVELTENARKVLIRRYVRRGKDGQPVPSPQFGVAVHQVQLAAAPQRDDQARLRQAQTAHPLADNR